MADGTIRVGTKIDFSGVKADIKAFEKELATIQKEADKLNAREKEVTGRYNEEREYDKQFPAEMSHREQIDEKYAKQLDPILKDRETLNQKAQEYNALLEQANAKLQEQSAIAQANKELSSVSKSGGALDKIRTEEQYQSLLAKTQAQMARIEASAEQIANKHGISKAQLLANNAEYQKLSDLLTQLESKQGKFGKTAEKTMKSAKKSTSAFGNVIKHNIKQLAQMGLAIFGVRGAFMAMRRAATSYLESNQQLKSQMESLWNIAGQAIGPVIEWLIKGISTLVMWVDSLVQALGGVSIVAKANAAALKKQASAGKAASASLAGFDEMNKLSDSSGGGGTGTFDTSIAGDIPKFLEDIKQKILEGDWFGAGEILGQAIMDGIMNIDWEGVGSKIGEILGGILGFALGVAVKIDPFALVGSINGLAAGLLKSFSNEIQNVDWVEVGKALTDALAFGLLMANPATAILAIILSPNGDELVSGAAEFIGTLFSAIFQALIGMAWRFVEIAAQLAFMTADALKSLKWDGTAEEFWASFWSALKAAFVGVGEWIDENIWHPLAEGFIDCIDWESPCGEAIAGLWEGLKLAWELAKEKIGNIWEWFLDLFREKLDIHSPSGKMKEFGGYIIDGLFNGITNGINKIKTACQTIWTTIKGVFSSVGSWFQTTFSNAWQKVKDVFSTGGKIFDGIKEGISSTFKTIVNGLIDGINRIIRTPFNSINSMLNTIRGIEVLGVSPFKNLWSYNPLSIPQIPKLALGGIVNRPGRGVPAIIGEAGAEAVLPLENNTEWMDMLADKIGGGTITIPINLDGKRIATYVVDIQKKKAFAMNGA